MSETSKFADLQTRFMSAVVMVAVGAIMLWLGGWIFTLLIIAVVFAMHWEMGRMLTPLSMQAHWFSAVTSVISLIWALTTDSVIEQIVVIIIAAQLQRLYFHKVDTLGMLVSVGITIGALLLIHLRNEFGMTETLWIIGLVVITDIAGYFFGRIVGGAKFWPAFSPKKTWSGVLGGWVGAVLFTYAMAQSGYIYLQVETAVLIALCLSFASQLGDITESALKRASGVKDSSNLIPGHGGAMDRFDGLIGASLAYAWILELIHGFETCFNFRGNRVYWPKYP